MASIRTITPRAIGLLPGLLLAAAVAIPSVLLHSLCKPICSVAIAIALGLLVRNLTGLPAACQAGNKFVVKKVLRLAIILLGAKLSFLEVLKTGRSALLIVVCCIVISLLLVQCLARILKLPARLGTLLGVGTCICGNSAIVATAPAINAREEEVAFAVATITLFGTIAVFVYPLLGSLASMTQPVFGTWAGTAINDTSQVIAAGKIFGADALKIATVVKLTRNLFMAPVIVIMSFLYSRQKNSPAAGGKVNYIKTFPLFVLGFVAMAVLNTMGVFSASAANAIVKTSGYLIVISIAAVGLGTDLAAMKKVGLKPFYVGLAASIVMAGMSFGLIKLLIVTQ